MQRQITHITLLAAKPLASWEQYTPVNSIDMDNRFGSIKEGIRD